MGMPIRRIFRELLLNKILKINGHSPKKLLEISKLTKISVESRNLDRFHMKLHENEG